MIIEFGRAVKSGKVVGIHYVLKNGAGEEIDRSEPNQPLEYLHGAGQIVPGLEKALEGMQVGEKKNVKVNPAEGYGEVMPELRGEVSRSHFPKDMPIEVGTIFRAQLPEGPTDLRIHAVIGDKVTVDANHPLAGETLHFDVEIASIRNATEEEQSHGHAHGPDGHHH